MDLGSQPSRSVHWLLMLLKAPFELKALRLDKGDTRTPEYLAINPFGKVPALQLPSGESLIESNAILVYLCSQFDSAGTYYPKNNALERARVDAYLHFHHEFRSGCAGWFQSRVWKNDDAAVADKRLFQVLDKFESYW